MLLALVWAVFLIPKALRHSDEAVRTRSIDRFSSATRVLARREPVTRTDARLVVRPPATRPSAAATEASTRAKVADRRKAARVAARRRRRILGLLVLCTAAVAGAAAAGRLAWPWVAVPIGLLMAFLVLCRVLVRRDSARRTAGAGPAAPAGRSAGMPAGPGSGVATADVVVEVDVAVEVDLEGEGQGEGDVEGDIEGRVDKERVAEFDDSEDTMGLSITALEAALGSSSDVEPNAGSLWDPLPVTLPTYVTKPRARRTVRTIDLGEPGTWTSGRTVEDAELAARATEAPAGEGPGEGGQHAVGS